MCDLCNPNELLYVLFLLLFLLYQNTTFFHLYALLNFKETLKKKQRLKSNTHNNVPGTSSTLSRARYSQDERI